MAMSDEVREQRMKLKDAPLKDKLFYYVGYYKWHAICLIVVSTVLIMSIYQTITGRRDKILYGVLIDANTTSEAQRLSKDVGELIHTDWIHQQVVMNVGVHFDAETWDEETYYSSSLLAALVQCEDLDFISAPETEFLHFAENGFFQELETCLPADIREWISDYYYYYTDEDGNTYPLGIHLDTCTKFEEYAIYEKHETILGIVHNSPNIENIVTFLNFIFER